MRLLPLYGEILEKENSKILDVKWIKNMFGKGCKKNEIDIVKLLWSKYSNIIDINNQVSYSEYDGYPGGCNETHLTLACNNNCLNIVKYLL